MHFWLKDMWDYDGFTFKSQWQVFWGTAGGQRRCP